MTEGEEPATLTADERQARLEAIVQVLGTPQNRAERRAAARAAKKKRGKHRARLHEIATRYENAGR